MQLQQKLATYEYDVVFVISPSDPRGGHVGLAVFEGGAELERFRAQTKLDAKNYVKQKQGETNIMLGTDRTHRPNKHIA